jgi:Cd2+/Zn2+-exporting ATPase
MRTPSTKQTTFHVRGLCCAAEEQLIRKKLESLPTIHSLQFNILSHTLVAQHTGDDADILRALADIGMPSTIVRDARGPLGRKTPRRQLVSTLLSGAALMAGGLISLASLSEPLANAFFLLAMIAGGWQFAWKAYKALKNLSLDMNVLMSIAAIGTVILGEYAEGAAVVFLFALSLLLESLSIDRSRRAIQSLLKLFPRTAVVKRAHGEEEIPVEQVAIGDIVVIRPGERIPLDGEVVFGVSSVDQSPITGESLPATKQSGDPVFAGTFNQRGALEVRVSKLVGDTTLAHIVELVEAAQSRKAPSQTFIENFARVYTPSVFILALLVATLPPVAFGLEFIDWFYRALVLLVIACPCALVISTPVTIVSALTNAARNGILIKGGRSLEELAKVRAVAFDKTGTLTVGRPRLTDIVSMNAMSEREILEVVTAVETRSEHHLAAAFLEKALEMGISPANLRVERFEAIPGKGVRATVGEKEFIVGSHQLMEELGVCSPNVEQLITKLEAEGKTTVLLTDGAEVIGALAVADSLREESFDSIGELHGLGIERILMLTGDSQTIAKAISKRLPNLEHRAELLPEEKLKAVEQLQREYSAVAMVGDGVNDAPALAAASVGIAMGGVGSDTSLETADVVLMSDDLRKIPYAIALGKKTLSIIRQNVVIALATKAVFLLFGIFGMTSLWLAVLADDGATLVVILNAFRLLRKTERRANDSLRPKSH